MAPKDAPKKPTPQIIRQAISESSLYQIPEGVIEGFPERLENGVDWTLIELAVRHHKNLCKRKEQTVTFSEALQSKIDNSIFGNILNQNSTLTLDQHWELLVPITLWDNEKFGTNEGKTCFKNANNITDDMIKMIRKSVVAGDRNVLRKDLMFVNVLRVNDCMMTQLDTKLAEFKKLVNLNLCGNYIVDLDATLIPRSVKSIELQANAIKSVQGFAQHLPQELFYIGLARNFLDSDSIGGFSQFPSLLTVLDLGDNDIYDLEPLLEILSRLPNLSSLILAGNPCSVCMGYAKMTFAKLSRLKWLDLRQILPTDRPAEVDPPYEPHPDDLRSSYFYFTILRIMSAAMPPKPEKGAITTFHVELEIPLLDSKRRQFLMFRNNASLVEMLPPPEEGDSEDQTSKSLPPQSKMFVPDEASSHESDIYKVLTIKNSLEIHNYTTFESSRVQWNKVMNFTEPAVKIFCPDLAALRDTFRSVITLRLVYSLTSTTKPVKPDKKNPGFKAPPGEQRVVIATIRCALRRPDWSQPWQHFHWDDSLGTNDAIHWGDGDLAVLQYTQTPVKVVKGKPGDSAQDSRQLPPDNLTCHFGFGIEALRS